MLMGMYHCLLIGVEAIFFVLFNNELFCVCLVSCIIIWGGVCASRLGQRSLPLFN